MIVYFYEGTQLLVTTRLSAGATTCCSQCSKQIYLHECVCVCGSLQCMHSGTFRHANSQQMKMKMQSLHTHHHATYTHIYLYPLPRERITLVASKCVFVRKFRNVGALNEIRATAMSRSAFLSYSLRSLVIFVCSGNAILHTHVFTLIYIYIIKSI